MLECIYSTKIQCWKYHAVCLVVKGPEIIWQKATEKQHNEMADMEPFPWPQSVDFSGFSLTGLLIIVISHFWEKKQ